MYWNEKGLQRLAEVVECQGNSQRGRKGKCAGTGLRTEYVMRIVARHRLRDGAQRYKYNM
jgi:hypothetical protein